jgi:DNA-binding MarR family transcriptional regulator
MRAWRAFLRAHDAVTRLLESELERERDLPLASYDVLVQLAETPAGALRMSELAGAVLLSRSGLTRLVDRLEREGLVRRTSCPSDARGTLAVLTDAGRARLREAAPVHLRGVREHFASPYDEAELDTLATLLERLAGPEPAPAGGGCGAGAGA